ncbi:hypothetical protein HN011_004441 [Eciton burchellii]|nr:hypothetical protein HN011_004441 [Eciton burchellii]
MKRDSSAQAPWRVYRFNLISVVPRAMCRPLLASTHLLCCVVVPLQRGCTRQLVPLTSNENHGRAEDGKADNFRVTTGTQILAEIISRTTGGLAAKEHRDLKAYDRGGGGDGGRRSRSAEDDQAARAASSSRGLEIEPPRCTLLR